jgi:transcription elongation factor Elf1
MKAASIISYILAGILILFSVLFILGAFGSTGQSSWLAVGLVGLAIGLGLVYAGFRFAAKANPVKEEVKVQLDLPGNVKLDTIKCQSCGAPLAPDDISLVNGAAVVTCHSCGTTYQITEEPKW